MTFHVAHRTRFLTHLGAVDGARNLDNAAAYGVRVQAAEAGPGKNFWQAIGVYHLAPEENQGRHAIYVDAVDEQGERVRDMGLRLAWGWEGQQAHEQVAPKVFDKPEHEPATNVDLHRRQRTWVCMEGDGLASDRVENLHSDHPDEHGPNGEVWNGNGHHSFYVVFQRRRKTLGGVSESTGSVLTGSKENGASGSNQGTSAEGNGVSLPPEPARPAPAPEPVGPAGNLGVTVLWSGTVDAAAGLFLREGPGQHHPSLALLPHGATVAVQREAGEWLQVESSVGVGWVAARFVRRPGEAGELLTGEERAVFGAWLQNRELLAQESARLGIDPGLGLAVLLAESRAAAFQGDRMVIRFENHVFYEQWGKRHENRFRQHFSFDSAKGWRDHRWRGEAGADFRTCHTSQDEEWAVFEFARSLDEQAAIASISMGAPQIMGFNFGVIGYGSPREMFEAFQQDAATQIQGMFRYFQGANLVGHLKANALHEFAAGYNGPGQAAHYAGEIRRFLAVYQRTIGVERGMGRGIRLSSPSAAGSEDLVFTPRLPQPQPDSTLAEADPVLYEAWRKHIEQGFANNQTMFDEVLRGFMNPYWTTVWMYRILFGLGVAAFVAAAVLAVVLRNAPGTALGVAALFGGLSVAAFVGYFLSRPLQSLEENLQFITWLGVIYNSYWARMAYIRQHATVQAEIDAATNDTIARLADLIDKHAGMRAKRPSPK